MLSSGSRRNIIVFGAGAAAIILVRALLRGSQAADPVTFIACAALLLEWILTVFERVAAKTARRSLLLMGLSFVAFYLLELARTRWFCAGQDTRLPLKYVSFIPVMAAPLALLFFTNSQGVGFDRGPGKLRILYAPLALLALGFVTNGLHFLAMKDPAGGLLSDGDYATALDEKYYYYRQEYVVTSKETALASAIRQLDAGGTAYICFREGDYIQEVAAELQNHYPSGGTCTELSRDLNFSLYKFTLR